MSISQLVFTNCFLEFPHVLKPNNVDNLLKTGTHIYLHKDILSSLMISTLKSNFIEKKEQLENKVMSSLSERLEVTFGGSKIWWALNTEWLNWYLNISEMSFLVCILHTFTFCSINMLKWLSVAVTCHHFWASVISYVKWILSTTMSSSSHMCNIFIEYLSYRCSQ